MAKKFNLFALNSSQTLRQDFKARKIDVLRSYSRGFVVSCYNFMKIGDEKWVRKRQKLDVKKKRNRHK